MTGRLRLVIFDVDGTLVDSQGDISAAMTAAFQAEGLVPPILNSVLGIVGLSLDVAMPILAPEEDTVMHGRLVQGYKDAYMTLRAQTGTAASSPLYPGAREALEELHMMPDVLLGVATGKSKRGLDKLIEGHGLEKFFVTRQVADFHPSKPHPSMIFEALRDAGVEKSDAVMVGDTSFDMDMAAAAGVTGIGVSWGYHGPERLGAAQYNIEGFDALGPLVQRIWETVS
ncbi:HAD family hydrolase [Sulfitobacter sp. SK012]|uniref:HAD-IA family hydrolase n=1 Tax=Sulfitobacter sp. SK012 TaxID=1389005 RepID=UPI000E0BB57C|nr:HAD-IA family hydrolase [Sulfitobacter sp. SK012]AXI45171.1 HAD family hydrolase [Sulfitobacter sp. SK012]